MVSTSLVAYRIVLELNEDQYYIGKLPKEQRGIKRDAYLFFLKRGSRSGGESNRKREMVWYYQEEVEDHQEDQREGWA